MDFWAATGREHYLGSIDLLLYLKLELTSCEVVTVPKYI